MNIETWNMGLLPATCSTTEIAKWKSLSKVNLNSLNYFEIEQRNIAFLSVQLDNFVLRYRNVDASKMGM